MFDIAKEIEYIHVLIRKYRLVHMQIYIIC